MHIAIQWISIIYNLLKFSDNSAERKNVVKDMLYNNSINSGSNYISDVIGLDDVKQILREAFVMPAQYPQLFQGDKILTF